MKKLFSYVLALTLLVSTMSVSFAAPADVTDMTQAQAVDVLMSLGVVNGFPDGSYKPGEDVTRAQMAKLIVTALGFEDYATDNKSSFTDMTNHWAKGYVETCVGLGIIKGYPDGTFKPENKVTFNEAATILVRALGWTDEAIKGTWPTNYVTKAMALKIFKDVKYTSGAADRGNVAVLLYNTLGLPIGTVDQNGKYNDGTYKKNNVLTWDDDMYRRLNVRSVGHGVVMGDEQTPLNIRPQVGTYVKFYQKTVIPRDYILFMNESTQLVGKFNKDLDTFKTLDDVEYYSDKALDAEDEYTDNKTIYAFKNGEKVGFGNTLEAAAKVFNSDLEEVAKLPLMVAANVSGKTFKNVYALNLWVPTKHEVITAKHIKPIEKDKTLLGEKFKKDNEGNIDLKSFELVGAEKLADIKENDVVYVYTGKSGFIRKVAVGTKVLEDVKITWTNSAEGKFKVDGEKYELVKMPAYNASFDMPKPGNTVNVRFDAYGKVYKVENISAQKNYAVVLGKSANTDTLDGRRVKLFLADGTNKIFSVDSSKYVAADTIPTRKHVGDYKVEIANLAPGTLVEYTLNGEVVDKLTPATMIDANNDGNADEVKVNKALIYNGMIVNGKTVVFTYKTDATDPTNANNYAVIEADKLKDKDIQATYVQDKQVVKAFLVTAGVGASPEYALFNSFDAIVGGTELKLIVALKDEDTTTVASTIKRHSDKELNGPIAQANGTLWKVVYNTDGKVTSLVAQNSFNAHANWDTLTDTKDANFKLNMRAETASTSAAATSVSVDFSGNTAVAVGTRNATTWAFTADSVGYMAVSSKVKFVLYKADDSYSVKDQETFTKLYEKDSKNYVSEVKFYDVDKDKVIDLIVYQTAAK